MIVKKTMFSEEEAPGVVMVGMMLLGGYETVILHNGKTQLHLCKHCFVHVYADHPLALLPDGARVDGEIVRLEESCIFEFDEKLMPTKIYSSYAYRKEPGAELEYRTSTQEVVAKV
ncbi:hypothetical protein [Owenweeksia hongkongensis]|uniref:hypothetical protein n=1 Tax=Owenweeksia hongkongensis TaxID=253245 RepID=UPI003A8F4701